MIIRYINNLFRNIVNILFIFKILLKIQFIQLMKHLIENQNWNLLSIWNMVSYIRAKWNVQRNETLECMYKMTVTFIAK